ncbi:DUF1297 domain-containing protein [Candidatus Peregrinibacteria bacterium]|nr:DUF1297 domain-containing protein [Candidatus Peregrinibacteria bacterium]
MVDVAEIVRTYDLGCLTVGSLGGHSALDVCSGAKAQGFWTVVVAKRGREKTYVDYFRSRPNTYHLTPIISQKGCVDETILVDEFQDVLREDVQEQLRQRNTIMVQSRYFWTYMDAPLQIPQEFRVPLFGPRFLLKLEDRAQPYGQYHLLRDAGIRVPKIFVRPQDIDRPALVKASEKQRHYERGFFLVRNAEEYEETGSRLAREGKIAVDWRNAQIEEFVVGAPVNFHFFSSPLTGELELLGTDTRRQTNLDGLLRMTADQQIRTRGMFDVTMVEAGHMACTVKESLLEKAFDLGATFVTQCRKLSKEIDPSGKGMIGPFALQGAIVGEGGKEDIVMFDVSFRIPGSPGITATPYAGYLYGRPVSMGERIAMELRQAIEEGRVAEVVT